jgi:YfiH family protein
MHGDRVHVLRKGEAIASGPPPCADIMVTNLSGFYLCIRTADCVPILFFDPVGRVVAAAHAGWRGSVRNVAARAVKAMQVLFGSHPPNIHAALGPAIGPCCYEIDKPVVDLLMKTNPDCWQFLHPGRQGHWMLDLQDLNAHQIVKAGLREENVQKISICTACRTDLFYSRRAEKGIKGEQFSLIGLTS